MRKAVIVSVAMLFVVGLADPGWAVFKPRSPGPEACKKWDCEGSIICSCCFADGCWICDSTLRKQPILGSCDWNPKISSGGAKINPDVNNGLHFTPANPGVGATSPPQQNNPN